MVDVVSVTARFQIQAGGEEPFVHAAATCAAATRNESGCIEYRLHRHSTEPGTFLFYENWRSKSDLDAHLEAPHLKTFLAEVEPVRDGEIVVELWDEIA